MALARFAAADRLGGLVEEWLDESASTVPITAPTTTTVADTSRITARREKAPVRLRALIARETLSDPSETSRGPSRPSRCGEYHPLWLGFVAVRGYVPLAGRLSIACRGSRDESEFDPPCRRL